MQLARARSAQAMAVTDVHIVDPVTGDVTADQAVVVEGERIVDVTRASEIPASVEALTGEGAYAIPGLIDGHIHATAMTVSLGQPATQSPTYVAARAARRLNDMLARGFTTVRDCGGADYGLAAAVDEDLFHGPRVVFGGKALSQTGGHADFRPAGIVVRDPHPCCADVGLVCDGVPEVRRATREQLRTGAAHVKMMLSGGIASPTDRLDSTQFAEEEIAAAVEETSAANRYVTGHAYTPSAINRALTLGVRCIEHGVYADEDSYRLFAERDAFVVPTLSTHRFMVEEGAQFGVPPDIVEKGRGLYESGLAMLADATSRGINVVFGTDLLGELGRHQSTEFSIRAKVVDHLDVLRSATTTAARLLNMPDRIGRIAPGYSADLCLLRTNPLDDIAAIARPHEHLSATMCRGAMYAGG